MDKTWIKLYRSLLDWCWFKDANTLQVFIYILLNANIEDHGFQNIIVKRGQIATSYPTICAATGLSIRSVRTAISHLKSTGELTAKQYPKFSLFTIEKYEQYQDVPTGTSTGSRHASDRQATGKRQASDTNIRKKESKKVRKEEYINIAIEDFTTDVELKKAILDFYETRKLMKKPMTDKAVDIFLKKLDGIPESDRKAAIEEAIEKGWMTVYPSNENQKNQLKHKRQNLSIFSSDASYDISEFEKRAIGMRGDK